jgi:chaperonin GroEL
MPNYIVKGEELRKKKEEGASLLNDCVSISLSPRGRNVGFFGAGDMAMSIHDGVEIARRVVVEDPAQYWAIRTILQAANKQVADVGDGTTLVTILANEIYRQAQQNIIAGANPRSLVDDLIRNRDILIEELKKVAIPVNTEKQAIHIATVSAQDQDLGQKIGEIVYKMGVDGVVTYDESATGKTYIDFQEGCQFENGYISPAFVTDQNRMEATVENTHILLTDKVLNNINELLPLLKQFEQAKVSSIVIIAQDVIDNALGSMILTKLKGGMNVLAIRAPYAGQVQKDFLDDIAVLTGGVVISSQQGRRFDTVRLDELGKATRVTSTEKATMIVGGEGDKVLIEKRIQALKKVKEDNLTRSDYEREKLKERIAKLSTGIAVVKVGAPLEIEMKNWLERTKDAIQATTAALKDGYVPGGEVIYLTIREKLEKTLAGQILYRSLEKPYQILLTNAGLKPDAHMASMKDGLGIDVLDGKQKDMLKAGIIDPASVGIEAIKNALSAAIVLFTTEILIMPIIEKKENTNANNR